MTGKFLFRYKHTFLLTGFLVSFLVFHSYAQSPIDQKRIDAAILDIYSTISGPIGKERDWQHWKEQFVTNPQFGYVAANQLYGTPGQARLKLLTLDEFIGTSGVYMKAEGFYEKEIHRETHQFGHLIQVFSTYECRKKETDAKPFMRGINSIMLVEDAGKFKIASLIWEQETDSNPIPTIYLPSTK
jgi:hypothetical protein